MNGTLFTGPTMTKTGLLMIGLLTALLLGGCEGSPATGAPTAAPTATPSGEEAAALEKVALSAFRRGEPGCGGCHTLGKLAFGKEGPDLTNIGARADAAYIRESIVDPLAFIVENCPTGPCLFGVDTDAAGMPLTYAQTLTEEEIDALVWYLTGLTGE